jgi:hypothetical protein
MAEYCSSHYGSQEKRVPVLAAFPFSFFYTSLWNGATHIHGESFLLS